MIGDTFRVLALPYGGPIPHKDSPRGVDLDGQWFHEGTDFGKPPPRVRVTWHHGKDPTGLLSKAVLGDAVELTFDDEGGWLTVRLLRNDPHADLVRRLAAKGVPIFGSSEAIEGSGRIRTEDGDVPWRRDLRGPISRWHFSGQTLTTSPQNTLSVVRPL